MGSSGTPFGSPHTTPEGDRMTTIGYQSSNDPRLSPIRTWTFWPLGVLNSNFPTLRQHIAAIAAGWAPGQDLIIETNQMSNLRHWSYGMMLKSPLHMRYDNHIYVPIDPTPNTGNQMQILGWTSGSTDALSPPVENHLDFVPGQLTSVYTGPAGSEVMPWTDHDEMVMNLADPNFNDDSRGIVVVQTDNGEIVAEYSQQLIGERLGTTCYSKWLNPITIVPIDAVGVYYMAMKWKKSEDFTDGTYIMKGQVVPRSATPGHYASSAQVGLLGWYADTDDVEIRDVWAGSYTFNSKQYGWAGHIAGARSATQPGAFMAVPAHKAMTISNAGLGSLVTEGRFTNMDDEPRLFSIQLAGQVQNVVAYADTINGAEVMTASFIRSPTAGETLLLQNLGRQDTGSEDAGGEMNGAFVSTMLLQGGTVNTCGDAVWELA